ncbi:MAG TPA: serine hydrolase [Streptosporangiaceae bacterium]|nr:serine hydrolase [Streptosporangiaceae bacterium]
MINPEADGSRRVSPKHRKAILLTATFAVAVLVADSVTLLLHGGRAADHRSAARSFPLGAALSPSTRTAASSPPAATYRPATSQRPATTHAAAHHNPLGNAARAYLATRAGTVLAAVYDEKTGQLWTLGQGSPQNEASIVKVDILETLLAQHRAAGTALSARDVTLAQEMIVDSDNGAATALWDEVGGAGGISDYNDSVGLTHTTPSGCVTCPGFPWPGWGLTTTTASDQIALLRELVRRNGHLTHAQQAFALGLMEGVTPSQRWGVAAGVPQQATVALKNGWLPLTRAGDDWQINSLGRISFDGDDYLIAVLTTGNPSEQYGIDTIDELSAIVWRYMR